MSEAQRYESVDVEAADGLIQSKGYTLLDVRCAWWRCRHLVITASLVAAVLFGSWARGR